MLTIKAVLHFIIYYDIPPPPPRKKEKKKIMLVVGHRPVNVKRAVIGSKGGLKLSTIILSCKVFHDWSIIKLGIILYLLDGSIFAVLFETTSHCFC